MKKSLLATLLLGVFSYSEMALAGSSVTMYGVVDAAVDYSNGAEADGAVTKLTSSNESGSRLGFKGTEDLGNGLNAFFVLEGGFNLQDGTSAQGERLWGRQSFVGLGGAFGAVAMGRQNTAMYDAHGIVDPFMNSGAGDINILFGRGAGFAVRDFRMDNAISYKTPDMSGFNATVQYGFGEVAGATAAQSQAGALLNYQNGPITAVYSYQYGNNADDLVNSDTFKNHFLGGVYNFGAFKLHAAIDRTTQGDDFKTQSYLLGATVPFGNHVFFGGYSYRSDKVQDHDNASQVGIGYNYFLSKRTNLYAIYVRTMNNELSKASTTVAGNSVNRVQLGMRHFF
jgi:predicted porin